MPLLCLGAVSAGVLPKIDLPKDSPVAVIASDYGESSETARLKHTSKTIHDAATRKFLQIELGGEKTQHREH